MNRFLVRYRFVNDDQISTNDEDNIRGIYRDANTLEQAFEDEKKLWNYWGTDIEFVEGRKVR